MTEKKENEKTKADVNLDDYEEVEDAEFFKFDKIGDCLTGRLIDKGESERYGFGLYDLLDENNNHRRFHGTKQLDDLLKTVNTHTDVIITYIDTQNMPEGQMKIFTVLRKKDLVP